MRVGLVVPLHGTETSAPSWPLIREQVRVAEAVGFDLVVMEDALLYAGGDGDSVGYWESVSMAAAIAATTSRIELGHSVINAPYRSAALLAKAAETLDEIAGGRFFLGIGAGNTPDYEQFGVHGSPRYARFAESIAIIHSLLRTGRADVEGDYQFARGAELVLRGPRRQGPPIVIAARGPKMLRATAEYADGWNWWSVGEPDLAALQEAMADVDRACQAAGRDPGSLDRSLDVYSVDPLGTFAGPEHALRGDAEEIAGALRPFGEIGFDEIRLNVHPLQPLEALPAAVEALGPVVEGLR